MARKRRSRAFKKGQIIDIEQARDERRQKRAEANSKRAKKTQINKEEPSKRKTAKRYRRRFVYGAIVLAIAILIGTSVFRLISLKLEESKAEANLESLKQEQKELQEELSLVYSKEYIEQQAREQLRMIYPGETLYVLKDKETNDGEN